MKIVQTHNRSFWNEKYKFIFVIEKDHHRFYMTPSNKIDLENSTWYLDYEVNYVCKII